VERRAEEGSVVEIIQEKIESALEKRPGKMILRVGEGVYEKMRGYTIWDSKWSEEYFMGIRVIKDPELAGHLFVLEPES